MSDSTTAEVEIKAPGLYLRFSGSPERIRRVVEFVMRQADEACQELKNETDPGKHTQADG